MKKKWISAVALVLLMLTAESMGLLFWASFIALACVTLSITKEEYEEGTK